MLGGIWSTLHSGSQVLVFPPQAKAQEEINTESRAPQSRWF